MMEALQKDNIRLQQQVELLKRQLKEVGHEAIEYITLDEAREKMQAAADRLMKGDMSAEKELDQLDRTIKLHPDYIKEEEAKAARWEVEQQPKCQEALKITLEYIPSNINHIRKEDLLKNGVSQAIVKRIFSKKILWFVRKRPSDIAKIHHADLHSNYTSLGLDIVEMRAVYAVIPKEFELDSDGKKMQWMTNFKQKMQELVLKEKNNTLMSNEKRHHSYTKHLGVKLSSKDTVHAPLSSDHCRLKRVVGDSHKLQHKNTHTHMITSNLMAQIQARARVNL